MGISHSLILKIVKAPNSTLGYYVQQYIPVEYSN